MTRPLVRVGTLFVLFCMALAACGAPAPAAGPGEIKLGLITVLTGDLGPTLGQSTVKGVKLAVEEVNKAGGLQVGGRTFSVSLLTEDDQNKAEQAVAVAQKLINQQQVIALVGPSISSNAIPVGDVTERARIPMISPSSTNPKTTEGKHYAFRATFIDPFQGRVLARFALSRLNTKKASVLYDIASDYNKGIAENFKQEIEAAGGQVVAFESYTTDEKDFSAQLAKIKASGATVLFLPNYDTEVVLQAQQIRKAGITATLLGSDSWSTINPSDLALVEGAYFSSEWNIGLTTPQSQAFVTLFRQTYGHDPDSNSAVSYDTARLILAAITRAGKLDPEAIDTSLAATKDYVGVTGTITYTGSGDPLKSVVINQIKDGKFIFAEQINP
jgi:branched-chain amino acid transport system substrate-binding protein